MKIYNFLIKLAAIIFVAFLIFGNTNQDDLQIDLDSLLAEMKCDPTQAPMYAELANVDWNPVKAKSSTYGFEVVEGNDWLINQFHECARQFEKIVQTRDPNFTLTYEPIFENADIRVAFNPGGTYSYMGDINYKYIPKNQHNMNIGWFEETGLRLVWRRSDEIHERITAFVHRHIHHELGHHYGIMHHQNMELAPIYFKDVIMAKNSHWTDVDYENSYRRYPQSAWLGYGFDINSLMLYYSRPEEYDTSQYGVITYNEIFSSQDTSMLLDMIVGEIEENPLEVTYGVGDDVWYTYVSSQSAGKITSIKTFEDKEDIHVVNIYNSNYVAFARKSRLKKVVDCEDKSAFKDINPGKWNSSEVSDSDRAFLDKYGAEIDRLNVILRGLE